MEEQKKSKAKIIIPVILALIVIGGGVFWYLNRVETKEEITAIKEIFSEEEQQVLIDNPAQADIITVARSGRYQKEHFEDYLKDLAEGKKAEDILHDYDPWVIALRADSQYKEENLELAVDFMKQVKKGDYFQMSADYAYGVGAHSAIMLGYDPETDSVHWMDSNMRGGKRNGIRYGIVQYDEVRDVEWWARAFCHRGRGATLYRLREDIVYKTPQ